MVVAVVTAEAVPEPRKQLGCPELLRHRPCLVDERVVNGVFEVRSGLRLALGAPFSELGRKCPFRRGLVAGREGVSASLGSAPTCPAFPGLLGPPARCAPVTAAERLPGPARCGLARSWRGPSVRGTGSARAAGVCISCRKSAAWLQPWLTENFTAERIVSATPRLWGLLWGNFAVLRGRGPS